MTMMLAFGIAFELPLLIVMLNLRRDPLRRDPL
jgi:Sec-independent protein secretion pathway component TatC